MVAVFVDSGYIFGIIIAIIDQYAKKTKKKEVNFR